MSAAGQTPAPKFAQITPVPPNTDPGPELSCKGAPAGSTRQTLAAISECLVVFCAAEVDANVKENLKHIDTQLGELQRRIALAHLAYDKFKRACVAIRGKIGRLSSGW
jgi:hypothetical protein